MDYKQVLTEIEKGRIRPVYLLHGEETYLAKQVERALINALLPPEDRAMNLTVFERDPSTAELVAIVETVPFMGGKNVAVIRGTCLFKAGRSADGDSGKEVMETGDERLLKLLGNIPDYSNLIFVTADKADKRRKIYKAVEQAGAIVELSPLKAKEVRLWITARLAEMGRKMLPDAQEYLLAAVSMMPQISLGFLDREIEKIALYTGQRTITRKDLTEIMAAVPEVSVFTMIEAVSQKQVSKALELLEEQLAAGENAIRLMALLARQVRMLWRGRELADRGLNGGQVAEQLAVPPFVGEKLVRQSRSFTAQRLRDTIVMLAEADRDLKSGRADTFVLEEIIIEMCR